MYLIILVATLLFWSTGAWAHNPFTSGGQDAFSASFTAVIVLIFWIIYVWGCRYATAVAWRRWLFHITILITFFTILGPLDEWAEHSSAAHMTQHMFMMVIIAPAFALARPLPQFYRACGAYGERLWKYAFKITQYPMVCTYFHGMMIWFWHIPKFYMLALENPWIHVFEHACFLISAVWFWWACLHAFTRKVPYALLALLVTLMHTGFLGAFLTFGSTPFYGESRNLADQQLAGLIMWVVGGVPYITAAFWVGHRWYRQLQRKSLTV